MKRTLLVLAALVAIVPVAARARQASDLATEGQQWWAHIQFLADDKLQGRNINTPGYEQAVGYVEQQFKAIGLKPAGTSGYQQPVKFESRALVPDKSKLALVRNGQEEALTIGQDATLAARGELDGSAELPMVFVGYGLSLPSAGWDDLKGVDLKGKIAVYVNAFPPITVSDNVKSHVNTAAERWAELRKAGAVGVATIAAPRAGGAAGGGAAGGGRGGAGGGRGAGGNAAAGAAGAAGAGAGGATGAGAAAGANAAGGGAAAGGGRGPATPQPTIMLFDRDLQEMAGQTVSLTFTRRGADKVLAGTGHTMDEFDQLVNDKKPLPTFALPGTLKAQEGLTRSSFEASNVVGIFEGTDPTLKNEYVVMSAHLDHVGVGRAVNGDAIYNGAMDDASGVASVIEIARLLKASGVKTKRSIIFITVTAEEKGELGSLYFAAKPTVPAKQIVADINLDMFLPLYALKVIEVQGLVESTLGDSVREAAKKVGVDVQTDREPEQNRFIRSDQYSFIRHGIPALAFKFGYEFGSPEETIRRTWVRDIYHQPGDDLNQPLNKEAAATFDRVIRQLLVNVANDQARPQWKPDSFFKMFAK